MIRKTASMTSSDGARAGTQISPLNWLPVAWLLLAMAMSAYHVWIAWPALNDYRLPPAATHLIQGEIAVAILTILGGLYVFALALNRRPSYPTAFTYWQGFVIAALLVVAIYTAIMPDFVMSLWSYLIWLGEIAIGIACIFIVRRKPQTEATTMAPAGAAPYSLPARIIFALLGIIVGGFLGFWIGIGIGTAISEATDMSCFEGACGYFVVMIGLAGILVGAIAGPLLALYWTRRRKA